MPQRFFSTLRQRRVSAVLALLAGSLAAPRAARPSSSDPPWAIEAPGAAKPADGARWRFGFGVESIFERQENLRIGAFEQFIEVEDLRSGSVDSGHLPGDPELLNRKFDISFERAGVGSWFSLALPSPGFAGVGRLFPTLTAATGVADVSLDFDDLTQSADSTSLSGRGALFETRLDLVATLCEKCGWFTATGFRFEKLPKFAVERSPRFGPEGFIVSRDEVRLGREVQEISSRVGYAPPGGRTASFVGVHHRWTALDVDDRLAYRNAFSETRLSSRTKLESETTLAVAGADVALGGGFFGRLETAVGDGDSLAWVGVGYLWPRARDRQRQRASEIARAIVPRLAGVLERFRAARERLVPSVVDGMAVYSLADVERLVDSVEDEIQTAISEPELAPMRVHVGNFFKQVRLELRSIAVAALANMPRRVLIHMVGVSIDGARSATARVGSLSLGATTAADVPKEKADSIMGRIEAKIAQLWQMGRDDDLVAVKICVTSKPPRATFSMRLEGDPAVDTIEVMEPIVTMGSYDGVYRGDWYYSVSLEGYKDLVDVKLDLIDSSRQLLECELVPESAPGTRPCSRLLGDATKVCGRR